MSSTIPATCHVFNSAWEPHFFEGKAEEYRLSKAKCWGQCKGQERIHEETFQT